MRLFLLGAVHRDRIGTRRMCATQAQWDEMRRSAKKLLFDRQGRHGFCRPGAGGGGPTLGEPVRAINAVSATQLRNSARRFSVVHVLALKRRRVRAAKDGTVEAWIFGHAFKRFQLNTGQARAGRHSLSIILAWIMGPLLRAGANSAHLPFPTLHCSVGV